MKVFFCLLFFSCASLPRIQVKEIMIRSELPSKAYFIIIEQYNLNSRTDFLRSEIHFLESCFLELDISYDPLSAYISESDSNVVLFLDLDSNKRQMWVPHIRYDSKYSEIRYFGNDSLRPEGLEKPIYCKNAELNRRLIYLFKYIRENDIGYIKDRI